MKKILLAGTAIVGVALLASPAKADLKLDLGGHARYYGVFADNDETSTTTSSDELRSFEFKRDFEVHFQGETTTDSGLTVGVHAELDLGNEANNAGVPSQLPPPGSPVGFGPFDTDPNQLDEAYMYFSGGWGRVNLGSEDGAAYLLQVAAPSADSNIDGMRQYVTGVNADVWDDQLVDGTFGAPGFNMTLGYDNAFFRNTDRLTYLTPKWNGFQAGASWAPKQGQGSVDAAFSGMSSSDQNVDYDNLWDIAARWDGEFEGFGISLGAGYTSASNTGGDVGGAPPPTGAFGSDDISAWDAGVTVTWNDFSLGVAVLDYTNTGVADPAGAVGSDFTVWTVGGAWDNGPYHLGATWYTTQNFDANAFGLGLGSGAAGEELNIDRFTVGGGYTYGPGMTFRGTVQWGNVDENLAPVNGSTNWTQVTLGTDVNF
jgi:outer membrane protein OmpU